MDSVRPPRRRRGYVAVLVAIGLVVGGWLAIEPLARHLTIEKAREHGIELDPGELELGWQRVILHGASARPIGLAGVEARLERLEVALDGLSPTRLEASGVSLELVGSAIPLALALTEWVKDHPRLFSLPASARQVSLAWRSEPAEGPWLSMREARIEPTGEGARLVAEQAEAMGVKVGRVGAEWLGAESKVALGFGAADLREAPVHIDVEHMATPPRARIELRATPLERLAGPIGVALPVAGVTARGEARLHYEAGPVGGEVELELGGYRPPVPRELSALVFGDRTEVRSGLELSGDRKSVWLRELAVKHGALELAGRGRVVRVGDHAEALIELDGQLACTAVAAAAARSRLGEGLGGLVAEAARRTLDGSVAVGVTIEADSRRLAEAEIARRVGLGCGLKLLKDWPQLPGIEDLPALDKLPKLEDLPGLPKLPPLGGTR